MRTTEIYKAGEPVYLQEFKAEVPLPAYVLGQSGNNNYVLQVIHQNEKNEVAYETYFDVPRHAVHGAAFHRHPMIAKSFSSVIRKIQASDHVTWQSDRAFVGVPEFIRPQKRARMDEQDATDDEAGGTGAAAGDSNIQTEEEPEITESQIDVVLDTESSPVLGKDQMGFGYAPVAKPASSFQKPVEEENTLPIEEPSQTGQ